MSASPEEPLFDPPVQDLEKIVEGLQTVSQNLPECSIEVDEVRTKFSEIAKDLGIIERVAAREDAAWTLRLVRYDLMVATAALDPLCDILFDLFHLASRIELKDLWPALQKHSMETWNSALIDRLCILQEYIYALQHLIRNHRAWYYFVRVRSEIRALVKAHRDVLGSFQSWFVVYPHDIVDCDGTCFDESLANTRLRETGFKKDAADTSQSSLHSLPRKPRRDPVRTNPYSLANIRDRDPSRSWIPPMEYCEVRDQSRESPLHRYKMMPNGEVHDFSISANNAPRTSNLQRDSQRQPRKTEQAAFGVVEDNITSSLWLEADFAKATLRFQERKQDVWDQTSQLDQTWRWRHSQREDMDIDEFKMHAPLKDILDKSLGDNMPVGGDKRLTVPEFAKASLVETSDERPASMSPWHTPFFVCFPHVYEDNSGTQSMPRGYGTVPPLASASVTTASLSCSNCASMTGDPSRCMSCRFGGLHISELWVVCRARYLVTCSDLSLSDLRRNVFLTDSINEKSGSEINVKGTRGRSWLLPPEARTSVLTCSAMFAECATELAGTNPNVSLLEDRRKFDMPVHKDPIQFRGDPMTSDLDGTYTKYCLRPFVHKIFPCEDMESFANDMSKLGRVHGHDSLYWLSLFSRICGHTGSNTTTRADALHREIREYPVQKHAEMYVSCPIATLRHLRRRTRAADRRPRDEHGIYEQREGGTHHNTAIPVDSSIPAATGDVQLVEDLGEPAVASTSTESPSVARSEGNDRYRPVSLRFSGCPSRSDAYDPGAAQDDLAKLALYVFRSFWPVDIQHEMTAKFWGAVHVCTATRLDRTVPRRSYTFNADLENFTGLNHGSLLRFGELLLRLVAIPMMEFTQLFVDSEVPRLGFDEFDKAWLHVLMSFVLLSNGDFDSACLNLQQASKNLESANVSLTKHYRSADIRSLEYCPPIGAVALCFYKLMKGVLDNGQDYVTKYETNVNLLDAEMMEDALQRSHQDTIRNMIRDVRSLLEMVRSQLRIWDELQSILVPPNASERENVRLESFLPMLGPSPMENLHPDGRDDLLKKTERLEVILSRLKMLSEWHYTVIDSNKDQQEAAVTVFTIVTVVFLPLSWVASIFGMNNADIREMRLGQWLYWIIALPFTFLILALAWWWAGAGKLGYLRRRKARLELARPLEAQGFLLRRKGAGRRQAEKSGTDSMPH